ncbi:hypothetical protein J4399_06850 [Candidatus Woesearchaeota archaeon]|nr:hypothetical protein [Candidatus Woesearchaeota archaeon]HIJ01939.1 hypothetical protein [Candidatus Woesearchaeota archaeon]
MATATFALMPVLVIGIILSILELIFVHQDEAGMGWLKHGLHAIPTMFIFIFISMNISYVLSLIGLKESMWLTIGIRVIIGIIAMIKISAAAAVAGRVGEKLPHTLIIGILVMVAPYIWELVLCGIPFIKTLPMHGCPKA